MGPTPERSHVPDHPLAAVFITFAEEPNGYHIAWLSDDDKDKTTKDEYVVVLTLLIVGDLNGELSPSLQTRIESSG
jgi:hypothetical protein